MTGGGHFDGEPFAYRPDPVRTVFGAGTVARVPDEVDALGLRRLLVLSTPGRQSLAEHLATRLAGRVAKVLPIAEMHVPAAVVMAGVAAATATGADGCVAAGGGSTIGLGKALALELGLPVVAVPTTYSGSEMTPIWGITDAGRKRTGRDARVLPRTVVYDPELTLALPVPTSVTSAMNALAHAAEALYAPDRSPVVSLMALEAAGSIISALPRVADRPDDLAARSRLLYGAWLCGTCLGATTMSLHHKLCHVLGGMFNLPHAATHTVMLPYVLAFNDGAPGMSDLRGVLGGASPDIALQDLAWRLGAPRSLRALGMPADGIEIAAAEVAAAPYANPGPVTAEDVRGLLAAAFNGAATRSARV